MALIHMFHHSDVLGRGVGCYVILPQKATRQIGMESAEKERIPVLWLLHGASDDHTIWQRRTSIERYVAPLGMVVVMPDVEISGYANQAHGGRFYDYISKELPAVLRNYYGLSDRREDNYICGLSMGGDGSLKIGLANPENYSVIGCLSAGIFNPVIPDDTQNIDPKTNWGLFKRVHGKDTTDSEERITESAEKIIREGKPVPRVFLSIGHDDFCMGAAQFTKEFFENFEGNPFDFRYEEHDGAHTWEYWDEHIQRFLQYVEGKL